MHSYNCSILCRYILVVCCLGSYVKYFNQLEICGSTFDKSKLFVAEQVVIIHVLTDSVSYYCLQNVPYYAGQTD